MSETSEVPSVDLGSVPMSQVEIMAEIARIESELEDPTLNPEEIRAKKQELETVRQMYKNLK